MFVRRVPQSQSSCQIERWNFNLDSLPDINHVRLISAFCAKLFHIHFSAWHHRFGCQHAKAFALQQAFSFVCMLTTGTFTFFFYCGPLYPPDSRILLQRIFLCGKVPLPRLHSFPIKPASSDSNYSNYSSQGCKWESDESGRGNRMARIHSAAITNANVVRSLRWQQQH